MRPEERQTLSIENSPWGLAQSTGARRVPRCRGFLARRHLVASVHSRQHVVANVAVVGPDAGRISHHVRRPYLRGGHKHNVGALTHDEHGICRAHGTEPTQADRGRATRVSTDSQRSGTCP
jgi:hypothetical protein